MDMIHGSLTGQVIGFCQNGDQVIDQDLQSPSLLEAISIWVNYNDLTGLPHWNHGFL